VEQLLDAGAALERAVGDEGQRRCVTKLTAPPDLPPQKAGRPLEGLAGLPAFFLAPETGEVNAGGLQVRRHFDVRDRDAVQDRVVRLDENEGRELGPDEIGDALGAAGFLLHEVSEVEELIVVLEDLAVQVLFHETQDALEQGVEGRLVGSYDGGGELGPLEEVLAADLGAGDLEFLADAALETAKDHPLLLQAPAARQVDVEDSIGDHHVAVTRSARPFGPDGPAPVHGAGITDAGRPAAQPFITPATFSTWKASMTSPTLMS
jgi:hypothetical protein